MGARGPSRVALAALLVLVVAAWGRAQAFDPQRHLPAEALVYAELADRSFWADALEDTWTGRLLGHERVHAATAELRASIQRMAVQYGGLLWMSLGWGPDDLLGHLGSGVAVALYDLGEDGGPPAAALVLQRGEAAAGLYAGLVQALRLNVPLEDVPGVPGALRAEVGPGALHLARLGDAVVLATGDVFDRILDLRARGDGVGSLGDSAFGRRLGRELAHDRRGAALAVNGPRALELLRGADRGADDAAETERVLRLSGLARLGLAGLSTGLSGDGRLEHRAGLLLLGDEPARGDVLGALLRVLDAPVSGAHVDGALARLPADARSVSAVRVDLAELVRVTESLITSAAPGSARDVAEFWMTVEDELGVGREALVDLPPLTLVTARVDPPAGGLLGDTVHLARDDELAPWWSLFEDMLPLLDGSLRDIDLGDGLVVRSVDWVGAVAGRTLLERLVAAGVAGRPLDDGTERLLLLEASAGLPSTRAPVGDGWTVLSAMPQSVERYLRAGATPRMARTDTGRDARERLAGKAAAFVVRHESWMPAVWNTLLAFAGPGQAALGQLGVDATLLPPAELLPPPAPRLDWTTLEVSANRLSVSASGDVLLPGALLLGAGVGLVALAGGEEQQVVLAPVEPAPVAPTPVAPRGPREPLAEAVPVPDGPVAVPDDDLTWEQAEAVHMERMQDLLAALQDHAADRGGRFPTPRYGSSTSALQDVVDAAPPGRFRPRDFVSPIGWEYESEVDADGRPQLDYYSCSWRVAPWPLTTSDVGPVLFDSKPYADGGLRHVGFVDGTIRRMDEGEFQDLLRSERALRVERRSQR